MLELNKVKKSFITKDFKQTALNNVSLKFRKDEFVSILGPSGSGKTTLLNIIGGLDTPDYGDLIINGTKTKTFKDNDWDSYRNALIGFVFQGYNLIDHISVYQNVAIALTINACDKKDKERRVINALKKVGLLDHARKMPNQLSGGQMQRVAIARALVNDPDIILADEPTGALDSKTSVQIMNLLKEVSKDKLVIMVTHNEELANKYSSRIIRLKDGLVVDDTNPLIKSEDEGVKLKIKKTKMSFLSALFLSLNNLKTKRGRTFLTSFASSIGIIGIALILSISNGFNSKIKEYEKDTMSSFPIAIANSVINFESKEPSKRKSHHNKKVLVSYSDDENNNIHTNVITGDFLNYIGKINEENINAIVYNRLINFNMVTSNEKDYKSISSNKLSLSEMPEKIDNNKYLKDNYDLLDGNYPSCDTDVILIVDDENRVDKDLLDALFINDNKGEVNFGDVIGKELKIVNNDNYYLRVSSGLFIKNKVSKAIYDNANITLKIVGILREKEDKKTTLMMNPMENSGTISKLMYSSKLVEKIVDENKESQIVKEQRQADEIIFMGGISFKEANITKNQALSMLGADNIPASLNIYPKSFESKRKITKYLDDYNKDKKDNDKIIYTDYAKQISDLSSGIIGGITIVLIAFSSISLLVSSIMIGIITYISVLERTKEIGILRSIGARKKDIVRVFNAETLIIGFIAGIVGIVLSKTLLIPINLIIQKLTDLKNVGHLNPSYAIILILISVILTLIGGYIPARKASSKDPVLALKGE